MCNQTVVKNLRKVVKLGFKIRSTNVRAHLPCTFCAASPFGDEKRGTEKLNEVPKATQLAGCRFGSSFRAPACYLHSEVLFRHFLCMFSRLLCLGLLFQDAGR